MKGCCNPRVSSSCCSGSRAAQRHREELARLQAEVETLRYRGEQTRPWLHPPRPMAPPLPPALPVPELFMVRASAQSNFHSPRGGGGVGIGLPAGMG